MKLEIKLSFGKWTVNNKPLNELDTNERNFMNAFFREMKLQEPIAS